VLKLDSTARSRHAGVGWFIVAAVTSVAGSAFGRVAGPHYLEAGFPSRLLVAVALASSPWLMCLPRRRAAGYEEPTGE
jgi:hypothetical protein